MSNFDAQFDEILAALKAEKGDTGPFLKSFRRFWGELEVQLLPDGYDAAHALRSATASRQYMIDILPTLQSYMKRFPRKTAFSILDIGPGTGHGSNLLASMYRTGQLGYKASVWTLDIRPNFKDYIGAFCPYIRHRAGDLYDLTDEYDIVMCSAVLEHVHEPLRFARKMQQNARGVAIIYAPYMEDRTKSRGHINFFDDAFLESLEASHIGFIKSVAWGSFLDPPYEMFIATLPGRASSKT